MRLRFSYRKSWNSPIMHTIYACPNLSKSLKGFPQKFPHCETKTIDRIVITHYPKNFDTRKTLKHRTVQPRCFSAMWDKRNQQNRDKSLSKKFSIPEKFWNTSVRLWKFSVLWDKKDRQNRDTAIIQKIFDSRTFLKHRRVRPRCFLAIWDKHFPTEKRDTPLLIHIFFPY